MAWVQIQDEMPEHPKLAKAGPLGLAMYIAGLCYCNRHLTDGFIPLGAAEKLVCWKFWGEPEECNGVTREKVFTVDIGCGMGGEGVTNEIVIDRLCRSGLWDRVDGGYLVHDYLDHQTSRQEVMAKRAAVNRRVIRYRNADCNGVGNADVTLARSKKTEVQKTEESKTTTLSGEPDVGEGIFQLEPPSPKRDPEKAKNRKDWEDGFNQFWASYPKRPSSSKIESLKVWMGFCPKDYSTADKVFSAIMDSLEVSKGEWQGREPDKIPHHVVWLRRELWRNDAEV